MNNPSEQIIIYSTVWCPHCHRVKKFFGEHRIPYQPVDIEKTPEAATVVEQINNGMQIIPTIVFPDGDTLVVPSNAALAEKFGLQTQAKQAYYDAIIIGSGPAGLTAATYLGREGLDVLVIEKAGLGGQAGITQVLENFPGFDEGITGDEFARRLANQARRFGAEILQAQEVVNILQDANYLCVTTSDGSSYGATAVLLATGATYRRLDVPGEMDLIGNNIHFCATCDGAFYKGKKVLVIGGGNSAFEEGLFLTKFASQVDIVHRRETVSASQILQHKVAEQENMSVIYNHAIQEFKGENSLEAIVVKNNATDELQEWHYDGVFIFIGLTPNSTLVTDLVETNRPGFVTTNETLMSSLPGLFAAGDVRAGATNQAASAAGEGAAVALMMRQYIERVK